ncbi:MAG: pyridoxal-phosphate dependent enzyme [Phycisphaerales bacterium]|nr:pyridoxal-phosphate dependent enzyme [Phycisphaerales bacterium]MCB9856942.1 pyridoxal-phosphate dependent enzyme [Phycisphaerales bacterium]MCB9861931.1 pyridoxal-phosphate dependent enzyme [Phycisphaerales bacterium]
MTDRPRYDGSLLLLDRYPGLRARVAWTPIGDWPTPILRADGFANAVGTSSFYIKREDLSHAECGGNKTRGLEFLIGRAQELGAECLVTFSSAGSHHIAKTAWHARQFGIDCVAVFVDQPRAEYVRRNMAAALACGARYVPANRLTVIPKTAYSYIRECLRRRQSSVRRAPPPTRRVCFVAPGGTSRRSMLGHVNAAFELKAQVDAGELPPPDYIFVVLGSLGTAAGLVLGLKLAGLSSRVVGVTVSYPWYATRGRLARFARRVNRWMHAMDASVPDAEVTRSDFIVLNDALGEGYALFTERGAALARLMFETQGLKMDGTYTAKALDGMMKFVERRRIHDSTHLFWHTYFEFPPIELPADSVPAAVRRYFETPGQPWLPSGDAAEP